MHTRASNYELVEPLAEPERKLNRRLRRLVRRVPFERRNERPEQPHVAADRVVALSTPGSAITIPETANEFSIKAQMDAMTMKMDAQYKEMKSRSNPISDYDEDDQPMTPEAEAKFMQTF
ncbi:hypothetical protein Tco_1234706 [Tanacetum coccineum]